MVILLPTYALPLDNSLKKLKGLSQEFLCSLILP